MTTNRSKAGLSEFSVFSGLIMPLFIVLVGLLTAALMVYYDANFSIVYLGLAAVVGLGVGLGLLVFGANVYAKKTGSYLEFPSKYPNKSHTSLPSRRVVERYGLKLARSGSLFVFEAITFTLLAASIITMVTIFYLLINNLV